MGLAIRRHAAVHGGFSFEEKAGLGLTWERDPRSSLDYLGNSATSAGILYLVRSLAIT